MPSQRRNIPTLFENDAITAPLTLFVFALILRLIRLFDLDLNFDESVLVLLSDSSFREIFEFCKTDNFPPLYPWMVKIWLGISQNIDWYRLLGALMGSLTPPAAYFLGRELRDRKLGWILGIATAISVSLIFYSQFVRMFNIQPLWVVLSLLWFIKALKTGSWKYWLLTAIANLIGFYVYIFMIIVFAAELAVLFIQYKLDLKRYIRPFIATLPFFIGVLIWLLPVLTRYGQVRGTFWIPPLGWVDYFEVFFFLGIGSDFRDQYLLAGLLNLPLIIGFLLGVKQSSKNETLRQTTLVFLFVILIFSFVSLLGQSFMFGRYLLFVLPLYLTIALAGWMGVDRAFWRKMGLGIVGFSMGISLGYYYIDYYQMHDYYGFVRSIPEAEPGEGHNLSKIAADVAEKIKEDEVIVHYSNPFLRVCSFYTALVYHQRRLSEHIYSKDEIAQHNGRQYLKEGEWIKSLDELDPIPDGIWMISLNDTDHFFDEEVLYGIKPPWWISKENLPLELQQVGFRPTETLRRGKVTAIHFRK